MAIKRTQEDFKKYFQQQLDFLKRSCESFDKGNQDECVRIAQSVRVLVHDTRKSTSLLTYLEKKNTNFHDTSFPHEPKNLLSHSSLVMMGVGNGPSSPIPFLDDGPFARKETFDNWWNGILFVDQKKNEFSRKEIVLTLANKEGGAHVGSSLNEDYFNLRNQNTLGWVEHFPGGKVFPSADQVPASMRQIGHEILKTFLPNYILKFETAYPGRKKPGVFMFGGSLVEGATTPDIPSHNPVKSPLVSTAKRSRPGRNDPCYCGSGKKIKKCCGLTKSR